MFLVVANADAETNYLNLVINGSDTSIALGCSVWRSYVICVRYTLICSRNVYALVSLSVSTSSYLHDPYNLALASHQLISAILRMYRMYPQRLFCVTRLHFAEKCQTLVRKQWMFSTPFCEQWQPHKWATSLSSPGTAHAANEYK